MWGVKYKIDEVFMNATTAVLIGFGLWLGALSVLFYWIMRHYLRLVRVSPGSNLKKVLDDVLTTQDKNKKSFAEIRALVKDLDKKGEFHVQKVSLVRYNPYNDVGGEHSFSLTALDGNLNGYILTCLHARERSRIYVKPVRSGKSPLSLSKEEEKAIHDAVSGVLES